MAQTGGLNSSGGVLLNVMGSALFALLYAWTHLLAPLNGDAIYGWRMLLTVPCMALFVLASGRWHEVRLITRLACRSLRYLAQRLLSALLLGAQLWLFMWAPINGYGLDVSLGYFLLPISMVIIGRLAFKDRISRLQLLACVLAVIGIACQLAVARTLSWPALVVCLGYPGYFWLRRVTDTNTLGATWIDMAFSLPVSLLFVLHSAASTEWTAALPWLIAGLGTISAAALVLQALSAPRLNLSLFGLLIYVEPVLLVVVSLLLGESIPAAQWPTYIAIWLAVLALVAEGAVTLKRKSAFQR
ncbi:MULTISPECIES: EamA family transporter RarD [unclassified Erwinia]|uniref:EamA family transporter RarD n=1 Tax=unclassified Erwinia TaxID=2622719 RepID=UPI0006FB0F1B|nr:MULTISPECIES: EamA family transporter RarD [unclassified Erwinia]KQN57971.1 chemotaxis protein [Erwinia sp. Leaf53]PLV62693.1 chemotaxis protein [Erwinia sp. B116]